MIRLSWHSPEYFVLLGLIPLLFLMAWWGLKKRNGLAGEFIKDGFLAKNLLFFRTGGYRLKTLLLLTALGLIVLVLARPKGELETISSEIEVRDTYFLLDISRSMLAGDIKPNRLEHAKKMIAEMVDRIEGSRVALIVFAGRSKISVPLTFDFVFFKEKLASIDTREIDVGGTGISKALGLVGSIAAGEESKTAGTSVILITDGEEQEGDPVETARQLAKSKIAVYTIGIGDTEGARVPVPEEKEDVGTGDSFLTYRGEQVITKLDEGTLRQIAEATQGVYVPAKKTRIDMGGVFKQYIESREKEKILESEIKVYREFYQILLLLAILLLCAERFIKEYND